MKSKKKEKKNLLGCDDTPVAAHVCVGTFVLVRLCWYICVNQACSLFKLYPLPLRRKYSIKQIIKRDPDFIIFYLFACFGKNENVFS